MDKAGNIFFVDNITQVPAEYREQLKPPDTKSKYLDEKSRKKLAKELDKKQKQHEKELKRKARVEERDKKKEEKLAELAKKKAEKQNKIPTPKPN